MFNTKDEFIAYVEYLQEFHPNLNIQLTNSVKMYTEDSLDGMIYKAGLAIGYTIKFIDDNKLDKKPLDVYSFLSIYRLDDKITDLLT